MLFRSRPVLTPQSPLPSAHPDARERGGERANCISTRGSDARNEAEMDGDGVGRHHLPLSRGSGCADGRGGRGVRAEGHGSRL